MNAPLEGIIIIDLTAYFAGPSAGPHLTDMGAQVIKVETRFGAEERRLETIESLRNNSRPHMVFNRGKKSIVLDLKKPQGKEVFFKLVERADVVMENFRWGVPEDLGIDYGSLTKINPSIIYCAMRPYGESGEYKDLYGYDIISQGVTGMAIPARTVEPPHYTPYFPTGLAQADMQEGIHVAYAIALALLVRQRTGRGQKIETNLLDSGITLLAERMCRVKANPFPIAELEENPLYRAYHTAEGAITIAVLQEAEWKTFCQAIGLAHLLDGPDYESPEKRRSKSKELCPILEDCFRQKTATEWLELLKEAGILCGLVRDPLAPVNNPTSWLLDDPQAIENDLIADVKYHHLGKTQIIGTPLKLSQTPGRVRGPAPLLGQHTDEILRWLGYTDEQIEALAANDVTTTVELSI